VSIQTRVETQVALRDVPQTHKPNLFYMLASLRFAASDDIGKEPTHVVWVIKHEDWCSSRVLQVGCDAERLGLANYV
jgi:hypothetical protein